MESRALLCLVGRSGSGKSVLARELVGTGRFTETVSATTRLPRPGERHGSHYHFISESQFARWAACGLFLEHASFGGALYGTPAREISDILSAGKVPVLVVEPQGAASVRAWCSRQEMRCAVVFIDAPTELSLSRMRQRHKLERDGLVSSGADGAALARLDARFERRYAAIQGEETTWAGRMPYDLTLGPQCDQVDTAEAICSVMSLLGMRANAPGRRLAISDRVGSSLEMP